MGDFTQVTTETGTVLPKTGVFAREQGALVAHYINRILANEKPDQTFVPQGKYFIEAGEGKAIEAGGRFSAPEKKEIKMGSPDQWGHFLKWWAAILWFFKNF